MKQTTKTPKSMKQSIVKQLLAAYLPLLTAFTLVNAQASDLSIGETTLQNPGDIKSSVETNVNVVIPILNAQPGYQVGWVTAPQGIAFHLDDDVITLSSRRGGMVVGDSNVTVYYQDEQGYGELSFQWEFTAVEKSSDQDSILVAPEDVTSSVHTTMSVAIDMNNPSDEYTVGWVSAPNGVALTMEDDQILLSARRGILEVGQHEVVVYYQDTNHYAECSFIWEFTAGANQAPELDVLAGLRFLEGQGMSYALSATDINIDDELSFSASGLPLGLTLNAESGVLSGYPVGAGNYSVTVTVEDAGGLRDEYTVPVRIDYAPWIQSQTDENVVTDSSANWWHSGIDTGSLSGSDHGRWWFEPGMQEAEIVTVGFQQSDGSIIDHKLVQSRHGLLAPLSINWAYTSRLGWAYSDFQGDYQWIYTGPERGYYFATDQEGVYYHARSEKWVYIDEMGGVTEIE